MKIFTPGRWASALVALFLSAVASVASAADFEPKPTVFTATESLNGTYEVTFAGCASDGLTVEVVNLSDYVLVDASGTPVPFSFVAPEMKDDYTVVFSVNNVESAPAGTYTIKVPTAAFCLMDMPSITSNAFDVTINYNNGGTVDPGTEVDPVNPGEGDDVGTFVLDDHKSDASTYYSEGSVLTSNCSGLTLRFDRVGVDNSGYTTCYKSNGGFLQLKDCTFTITAPEGYGILKIEFVDGAPQSTTYDPDNIEAKGYDDCVWNGYASSVTFKTKVFSTPIYDYDDEDNEYITGYAETVTGARVAKIFVTLDSPVDKDPDGIALPTAQPDGLNTVVYDLNGRVYPTSQSQGAAGSNATIVIRNGKKVVR